MTFLEEPVANPRVQAMYDAEAARHGYVMGLNRVWAHDPDAHDDLFALLGAVATRGGLSMRERGVLIAALAPTMGDAYCSLAWGTKLSDEAGPAVAAAVLSGTDEGLTDDERALAAWARQVVSDPNGTTAADVATLRAAGLSDAKIFAVTTFVALRQAFSTVHDALGAVPDEQLRAGAPAEVAAVVTWGRQPAQPNRST